MDKNSCVIYAGQCFTVEWYFDCDGYSQAYEYFLSTTQVQKRRFLVLVKRIAEMGKLLAIKYKKKFINKKTE